MSATDQALRDLLAYIDDHAVFDMLHRGTAARSEDWLDALGRAKAALGTAAPPESPFVTYRPLVMGHYGTAHWLRQVVLSLWNGKAHPVRLDRITGCDERHRHAVLAMLDGYARHGENDAAFLQLAQDILAREQEDAAEADRVRREEER